MAEMLGTLFIAFIVLMVLVPVIAICVIVNLCAAPVILYKTWGNPERSFSTEFWNFTKKNLGVIWGLIESAIISF